MTVQTLIDNFRLISDQKNAPYFTDENIVEFLNLAQERVFSRYFENRSNVSYQYQKPLMAFQLNDANMTVFAKLIYDKAAVNSSANGVVTYTQINGASPATTDGIYQVLNVRTVVSNVEYEAQFKNWREVQSILRNVILTPTNLRPLWTYEQSSANGAIQLFPKQVLSVKVRILKNPATLDLDTPNQVPELADFTHEEILYTALELAGIAMRDEFVYQGSGQQAQKEANP